MSLQHQPVFGQPEVLNGVVYPEIIHGHYVLTEITEAVKEVTEAEKKLDDQGNPIMELIGYKFQFGFIVLNPTQIEKAKSNRRIGNSPANSAILFTKEDLQNNYKIIASYVVKDGINNPNFDLFSEKKRYVLEFFEKVCSEFRDNDELIEHLESFKKVDDMDVIATPASLNVEDKIPDAEQLQELMKD